jgi:hypothetical protein
MQLALSVRIAYAFTNMFHSWDSNPERWRYLEIALTGCDPEPITSYLLRLPIPPL